MSDKNSYRVRLRLKKDHSVVLPEALLDGSDNSFLLLDYDRADSFLSASRDDWEISPPRPDEKIQLRMKSDPTVVLPEARLVLEEEDRWRITYPGTEKNNILTKEDWEVVDPKFVLPTGIGAVVQFSDGSTVVRVGKDMWRSASTGTPWEDGELESTYASLTVLSEGADIWEKVL